MTEGKSEPHNQITYLCPYLMALPLTSVRHYNESINALHSVAHQLSTRPETNAMYKLRLYPISLERTALLTQLEFEERNATESADLAYNEERERVEEEWKRGRERVRERLLEGIEERRRRAREEKDGEGTAGGARLADFYPLHLCNAHQTQPSTLTRAHQ